MCNISGYIGDRRAAPVLVKSVSNGAVEGRELGLTAPSFRVKLK